MKPTQTYHYDTLVVNVHMTVLSSTCQVVFGQSVSNRTYTNMSETHNLNTDVKYIEHGH